MATEKYEEMLSHYYSLASLGKADEIALYSQYEGVKVFLMWEADADACERCQAHQGEVSQAADWDITPPLHPHCDCEFSIDHLEFDKPFASRIAFDNGNLVVYDQNGYEMYRTIAESGMVGKQESKFQVIKDVGPLPEGKYRLTPDELDNPGEMWDKIRNIGRDWGSWRVRLYEEDDTLGRSVFFLHGGRKSGSKGCIEFGGWDDAKLRRLIEDSPYEITVEVDYGNDLACTP